MKGSKKAARQEKATTQDSPSALKNSPILKARQSIGVKCGVNGDIEPPLMSSASPTTESPRRKFGPDTAYRQTKASNSSTTSNLKGKPRASNTTGAVRGPQRPKTCANKSSGSSSLTSVPNHYQKPLPRKGECEICRQPCRSHCAGCKRVFYCSKQHQQADWSNHKLTCRPFSIPTQYSSGFHPRPPGTTSSTSFNSSSKNPSSPGTGAASNNNLSPELQFMISTKQVAAGSILFTEKPLLVSANVFTPASNVRPSIWCCSCLKVIPYLNDRDNINSKTTSSTSCPKCQVPLCVECLKDLGNIDAAGLSKKFHGGQGHSSEECALISDLCHKTPHLLSFTGNEGKSTVHFMKDLTILRVLMFRTACPWRWESLMALRNSPRFQACCKHNIGNLEAWLANTTEYLMAGYYMKNVCKEKDTLFMDVVKIIGVFLEVSARNPSLLVLYENLSWLSHACTANAEQFFRQVPTSTADTKSELVSLELIIKAVDEIEEGSKITLNYLTSFEGGRSALALKLFQSKGHYCCDTECVCHQPCSFDKTMGIRCDLIFSTNACSGILSPRLDAPNPEKPNLGLGMFVKSKKWECDKCKKSEKYEILHTKIMEIAQDLTGACDRCCNGSSSSAGGFTKVQQSFLQLQNKLLSSLSDHHWMVWKAKLRILKSWTASIGYGSAMLRLAASPQTASNRAAIIYTVKQKVDMYGRGIYSNDTKLKASTGVLELFAKRHGQLSPKRGYLLFDTYFANLIALMEDYKKELPLPSRQSDLKMVQVARENCKKIVILRKHLDEVTASLKVAEGTTLSHASAKSYEMAKESLQVLIRVCSRVEQRPTLIIAELNDLLEVYACQDPNFIRSWVRQSEGKGDPFRQGFIEEHCVDFEVDTANLGSGVSFVFGPAKNGSSSSSKGASKSSSGSHYTFGENGASSRFGFSGFGSPSFGMSDMESCSDIDADDDDNPFIYSRSSSKNNRNNGSYKHTGGTNGKHKANSKNKKNGDDEEWSSYFWFSSDDENPLDEEFDLGFTSSPRSSFGGDLFNDQELEDLAEWAAIQFMMGKMKL